MDNEDLVVIGAGPVGLALSLCLSKLYNNKKIVIYESRSSIIGDPESSYPIGINPRSLTCFREIDQELEQQMINASLLIKSWDIYGGKNKVASVDSNTVYGTTRNTVNSILYEYVNSNSNSNIDIKYNHKLQNIDFKEKKLHFQVDDSSSNIVIDATNSRIFACDGVNSIVRNSMNDNDDKFHSHLIKWNKEFRVLFQDLDVPITNDLSLNPDVHYIINGIYAATIRNSKGIQWTAVIGIGEDDNDRDMLLSNECNNENVSKLKEYLNNKAPQLLSIFPTSNDEPFQKYFSKRSFKGSIVSSSALNHKEWIVLLGDAAHSLIPPTGEGINSGMEDVLTLYELLNSRQSIRIHETSSSNDNNDIFETYNTIRFPDIQSIVSLAIYLNENFIMKGVNAAARLGFQIAESIIFGKDNYSNDTFGPNSIKRIAYSKSISKFHSRKKVMLPLCQCCCLSCYCCMCCWIKDIFTSTSHNTKTHTSNVIHEVQTMDR
jgi:kynurenine 3-monooxygenase